MVGVDPHLPRFVLNEYVEVDVLKISDLAHRLQLLRAKSVRAFSKGLAHVCCVPSLVGMINHDIHGNPVLLLHVCYKAALCLWSRAECLLTRLRRSLWKVLGR